MGHWILPGPQQPSNIVASTPRHQPSNLATPEPRPLTHVDNRSLDPSTPSAPSAPGHRRPRPPSVGPVAR
eukprot:8834739-Pyramimonas_sp.AAC.1